MEYNYSREKRKFDAEWKKKEEWYRESGMSEEVIHEIFTYDWAEFNATRKFYRYMEDVDVEQIPEKSCDILETALAKDWTELLDSPEMLRKIRKLPADYIEIIEMLYFENLRRGKLQSGCPARNRISQKRLYKSPPLDHVHGRNRPPSRSGRPVHITAKTPW